MTDNPTSPGPGQRPPGQPPQNPWGPYSQPYPPPQPPPRRKRHIVRNVFAVLGGLVVLVVILSVALGGSSKPSGSAVNPAATLPDSPAASSSSSSAAPPTVEYIVTGSPADVTYGPAGSNFTGTVPMRIKAPLGSPSFYSVNAQLNGPGSVSCKIKVNGAVISRATASGAYQIASCEISQDPLSGDWTDDNTG